MLKKILIIFGLMFLSPVSFSQSQVDTIYYSNGNIKELRPINNNNKFHGTCVRYSINGDTLATANYKNGKKHGTWKIWRENKTLAYEFNYVNGQKSGLFLGYDQNNNIILRKVY
ncbi:MAG: toxin-antitoxin system YwqK family antitoxin [bacterium]